MTLHWNWYRVSSGLFFWFYFMRCEDATLAECPVRARWHFYVGPLEIRRHR